jgi:hypothetical protein
MFDKLTAIGYGVVVFAIVIGIGTIVLTNFGSTLATCGTGFAYTQSVNACVNSSNSSQATVTPTGAGYTNVNALNTQLGTTGLAGWTPAVIAVSVGLLFLGAFMIGQGGKGRY